MLNKIVKILSENKNNSQGLLTGNAGEAIFLYHVFMQKGDASAEKLANSLLDGIFDFLDKRNKFISPVFGNGLAGIGWCMEYLVEHKFCEGDTDYILEDIDNSVFKTINEQELLPLDLQQGLTGYLFYVISRLKNKSSKKISTRINQGLLIKIINKLDERPPELFQNIGKEIQFDLLWEFPVLFSVLDKALELNIHNRKITTMVEQWMFYLNTHLPGIHGHRLSLALSLYKINKKLKREDLEKQIRILLYSIDVDIFRKEINPYKLNLQYGWYGAILLLYLAGQTFNANYPNYDKFEQLRREILSRQKDGLEKSIESMLQPSMEKAITGQGLFNGLSGIGMLYLFCPAALTD